MNLLDGLKLATNPEVEIDSLEPALSTQEEFNQLNHMLRNGTGLSKKALKALLRKTLADVESADVGIDPVPAVNLTTNEMWRLLNTAIESPKEKVTITEMFKVLAEAKGIPEEMHSRWAKKAARTALYSQTKVALKEALENIYRYSLDDRPEIEWDKGVLAVRIYKPLQYSELAQCKDLSNLITMVRNMTYTVKNTFLLSKVASAYKKETESMSAEILQLKVKVALVGGKKERDTLIIELTESGSTAAELASLFGVSVKTVQRAIKTVKG